MFDVRFLNRLREAELDIALLHLRPSARLLEFGAGTGVQAKALKAKGFDVIAIDLPASDYSDVRQFPVKDYDGRTIPLPDADVDLIFSSNTLEHVVELSQILAEFRRVTRPGGYGVHLMPSVSWRFWTFAAGPPTAAVAALYMAAETFAPPPGVTRASAFARRVKTSIGALLPVAHGTSWEGISELWTFSVPAWRKQFERHGFAVEHVSPIGLFHTGHMLFGPRLSIERRKQWAKLLGSAANVFVVRAT